MSTCQKDFTIHITDADPILALRWYGAFTYKGSITGNQGLAFGAAADVAGDNANANISADNTPGPSLVGHALRLHFRLVCQMQVEHSNANVRVAYNDNGTIYPNMLNANNTSGLYEIDWTTGAWLAGQQGWQIVSGKGAGLPGNSVTWSLTISLVAIL